VDGHLKVCAERVTPQFLFRFMGVAFAIALCASAALALPTKAEAAIHLGSPNTVSLTNGLVGYWPLDGFVTDWNTNTTADISGSNNLRLTSL
jgi:hypothetical protein